MEKMLTICKSFVVLALLFSITFADETNVSPRNFTRSRYNKRLQSNLIARENSSTTEAMSTSEPPTSTKKARTTTTPTTTTPTTTTPTTTESPEEASKCGIQFEDNHPWIAVLQHTHPKKAMKRRTLSKGVLIGDNLVLTTLSSIQNSFPFWVVSSVRLGDRPTWAQFNNTRTMKDVVARNVSRVFLHQERDIALVVLEEPVNVTDHIRPICLPPNDNYNYRELWYHMCEKRNNNVTNQLLHVTPVSPSDCHILFERQRAPFTEENFCAWDETGDTCTGDLGGPLMAKYNGLFYAIGLNSFVPTSTTVDPSLFPGVYVRVGSHLNWIQKIVESLG